MTRRVHGARKFPRYHPVHGASSHDFEVRGITVDDIRAAARNYLPTHKGAYVRLALFGQ